MASPHLPSPSQKQRLSLIQKAHEFLKPAMLLLPVALLAASLQPVIAADPTGDQILRQMSDRLASAHSFSFKATREIDASLLPGISLSGKARISAVVQRPDKFAVRSVTKDDSRQFIADGRTLTLFDSRKNFYAVVPMRKTIDALVDEMDSKYGFTPPLADFALSNPYQEFRRQARTVVLLGRATTGGGIFGIGGVECDRLLLKGPVADAELWIGVRDHLPRKLVATFHRRGHPRVQVDFQTWILDPSVTSDSFTFTPPKGALKIEMWSTAKMQAARKH